MINDIPFTIDQLKILRAIIIEGSFNSAAKSLYLSQPAITLQIQNLEKQLSTPLFERENNKIKLTFFGKVISKYGDRILRLCEETCKIAESFQKNNQIILVIGISKTISIYLINNIVKLFLKKYPKTKIQLEINSTKRILWGTANGQIDIAIVGGKIPHPLINKINTLAYIEDELVLILPKISPFEKIKIIKKEELYNFKFICLKSHLPLRRLIEKILKKNGIDIQCLKIVLEVPSIEGIKNAVKCGFGIAFIPISSVTTEMKLNISIINCQTINRKITINTNPKNFDFAIHKNFIQEILNLFIILSHTKNEIII
uniref:LysR transcriptional regulator n=1 Tax=Fibrocapsa japonica TaxID=94617 RepID=UPI0021152E45|nr:LysR transcriptional regulator [Fibrocapsa japonica]UTE95104.1 LysR transcriptional regulator [Fibrocapsa japonica]